MFNQTENSESQKKIVEKSLTFFQKKGLKTLNHYTRTMFAVGVAVLLCCWTLDADDFELVKDGKPAAVIVTAKNPTISANLAALELQYHIKEMSDVSLPIEDDETFVGKNCILVGESKFTRELGACSKDFQPTEYMIRFLPNKLILIGQDLDHARVLRDRKTDPQAFQGRTVIDYNKTTGNTSGGVLKVTLPSPREEQGTCYAVYDFLERFCNIRWYGPSRLNMVCPKKENTLSVARKDIRRFPSIRHRETYNSTKSLGPMENKILFNNAKVYEYALFSRRMRDGGLRWMANHSALDGDWMKDDATKEALGYTDPRLVDKLVKVAQGFFDGKGLPAWTKRDRHNKALAMGDYFAIVPHDAKVSTITEADKDAWRISTQDERGTGCFGRAGSSYYVFQLINSVAKELMKTHPKKKIATLAYNDYSYPPKGLEICPNISVALCLAASNGYDKEEKSNDLCFYKAWAEWSAKVGGELFVWNYFNEPYESAYRNKFTAFPFFMGDIISQNIGMYVKDNVKGVFSLGSPLQPDFAVYARMSWDRTANPNYESILDEFFEGYFGNAAQPMRRFYDLMASANREEKLSGITARGSWRILGTDKRLKRLQEHMSQAKKKAVSPVEVKRVRLWHEAFISRMLKGKNDYELQCERLRKHEAAAKKWAYEWEKMEKRDMHDKSRYKSIADSHIPFVRVLTSSALESPYSLVNGKAMRERLDGVFGTKQAELLENKTFWCGYGNTDVWVELDLLDVYSVDKMIIWNYPNNGIGMKRIKIELSLTGRHGDWDLFKEISLKGNTNAEAKEGITIDLQSKKFRFVRITGLSNYGNLKFMGLGQVRLYGSRAEGKKH